MESKDSELDSYRSLIEKEDFGDLEGTDVLSIHTARDRNVVIILTPTVFDQTALVSSVSAQEADDLLFLYILRAFLQPLEINENQRFYFIFSNTHVQFTGGFYRFYQLWGRFPSSLSSRIDRIWIVRPSCSVRTFLESGKWLCPSTSSIRTLNKIEYLENSLPFHPDTKHTDDMTPIAPMIENLEFVSMSTIDFMEDDLAPLLKDPIALLPLIDMLSENKDILQTQGIFRVSEGADVLAILKAIFRETGSFESVIASNTLEAYVGESRSIVLAQLLKHLIYESLAASLFNSGFTNELYDTFSSENMTPMRELLQSYKEVDCVDIFKALMTLLREVTMHEHVNLMSARNLSVVFSPTLFPSGSDIAKMGKFELILRTMLENFEDIFH